MFVSINFFNCDRIINSQRCVSIQNKALHDFKIKLYHSQSVIKPSFSDTESSTLSEGLVYMTIGFLIAVWGTNKVQD